MSKAVCIDYQCDEAGNMKATHAQVVGHILNQNEEERKNSDENWQKADEDIKPVGRIPRVTAIRLQQMGILDDANELMKWLERYWAYKRTEKQLAEKPKIFFDLSSPPSIIKPHYTPDPYDRYDLSALLNI